MKTCTDSEKESNLTLNRRKRLKTMNRFLIWDDYYKEFIDDIKAKVQMALIKDQSLNME